MFGSIENIWGKPTTGNGLNEGINEAPENKEIQDPEGLDHNEADLERVETAAGIMREVFTDEVISNWENLSIEERTSYLNEYYAKAGQALGIDTKGVYVDDLYALHGYGTMGVNCGNGYLGIDVRLVADASQLGELLNTTTHEMRHQLQSDALRNPDAFPDIPRETLAQWEYEFKPGNYIDPSYDFEAYENQAIESDARNFAEDVVDDFLSAARSSTYSAAHYEADIPAGIVADGEQQSIGSLEQMSAAAMFDAEAVSSADDMPDLSDNQADVGTPEGLEADTDLNRTTVSYTAGQCARISTGTQNYCPFAGSGR